MRKLLPKLFAAMLILTVIAGALWTGLQMLREDYVFWNGSLLPRQAQSLDISGKTMKTPEAFLELTQLRQLDARNTGMTLQQYEWFRREMPACQVLWDVPIQGKGCSQDTRILALETVTEEDLNALAYLPELETLELGREITADQINAIRIRYPECTLHYQVEVAGEWWDADAVSLVVRDADAGQLARNLSLFEHLESVLLTGRIPALEELENLQAQYPDIFFLWKLKALGRELETDIEILDLPDGVISDVQELEGILPWLPKLKTLRLSSLGLPQEELVALAVAHPQITFVFDLVFGDRIFSTGAEEIDLSNMPLENTAGLEAILPCFRNLKKVVMCNCGISSEDMDALGRRYADIRFVWSVDLAGKAFRTDAVHFTPNRWGLKCTDENIADLRYCRDMVCVDIGHATMVTSCEWVRNMPELKYLILAETSIADISPLTGHENLIFLELFLTKVKDVSPLATCKALEDLNLCYTIAKPEPVGEMVWLKRLWWTGVWDYRNYLAEKLPDTELYFGGGSSTGRGWREGQHYYDMRDFIGMDYMTG